MQKKTLSGSTVTVRYRYFFRTLLDRNMKRRCHAIFFLQRLDPVSRGYITLDRTHNFHRISGDSPENLRKLLDCEKFHHPGN